MDAPDNIPDIDTNIHIGWHLIETYSDNPEWVRLYKPHNVEHIDRLLERRLELMNRQAA